MGPGFGFGGCAGTRGADGAIGSEMIRREGPSTPMESMMTD
jgi:hypothetical protein